MSIQIIYYTIVIPINNLKKCNELQDLDGALKYFREHNKIKAVWHDNELLTIGGIMSPLDVRQEVTTFEQLGLNPFKIVNGKECWDDLCVVSVIDGPTRPCSWLEVNINPRDISYAWLKGMEVGNIIKPLYL